MAIFQPGTHRWIIKFAPKILGDKLVFEAVKNKFFGGYIGIKQLINLLQSYPVAIVDGAGW